MRPLAPLLLLAGVGVWFVPRRPAPDEWTILISGDTRGYLSPCGCTKPMMGGVRRRVTAIQNLTVADRTLVMDSGNLAAGVDRQSVLKAQALAEILGAANVDAVAVARADAELGKGELLTLAGLAKGRLLATGIDPQRGLPLLATVEKGPFTVGSLAKYAGTDLADSARSFEAATPDIDVPGRTSVVMLDGDESAARELARQNPELALIVFRRQGEPVAAPLQEGKTLLVTPGERGKFLIKMTYADGAFSGYRPVALGPELADHDNAQRIYYAYLDRVTSEDLLSKTARAASDAYAGSEACRTCHQQDYAVWRASAHGHALKTLEDDHHGRDPDCVKCHVVGLEFETGFRDRTVTPNLADVGCESCHGPAANHAMRPVEYRMPKIDASVCEKCHVPDHSPQFEFSTYWPKIAHGMGITRGLREGEKIIGNRENR